MTLSLFKRGFIQTRVGSQTRDMSRWHWSFGTERFGPNLHFDWSFHVPNFNLWFNFIVRKAA